MSLQYSGGRSLKLEHIQAKPVRGQCGDDQIEDGVYTDPITAEPLPRYAVRVRVDGSQGVKECYAAETLAKIDRDPFRRGEYEGGEYSESQKHWLEVMATIPHLEEALMVFDVEGAKRLLIQMYGSLESARPEFKKLTFAYDKIMGGTLHDYGHLDALGVIFVDYSERDDVDYNRKDYENNDFNVAGMISTIKFVLNMGVITTLRSVELAFDINTNIETTAEVLEALLKPVTQIKIDDDNDYIERIVKDLFPTPYRRPFDYHHLMPHHFSGDSLSIEDYLPGVSDSQYFAFKKIEALLKEKTTWNSYIRKRHPKRWWSWS